MLLGLMALIAPAVIPPTIATIKDNKPSCAEIGNASPIISFTLRPSYLNDGPKSPVMTPPK